MLASKSIGSLYPERKRNKVGDPPVNMNNKAASLFGFLEKSTAITGIILVSDKANE